MKDFFKYVLATVTGIIVVSLIGIFLFFIVIGAIVSSAEKQVSVNSQSLLLIDMTRQIVDRAPKDPFEDLNIPGMSQVKTTGLDEIRESLEKAVVDDRIKGIYLKLGLAGGEMASIEEIRNMLKEFKTKSDKPIYAHGDFYDQKSYYLATVAHQITIHPLGSVDFRGLGGEMLFFKNTLEKIGIEPQIIRQGKFKAAIEPFTREDMSRENREQQLVYLNSLWNHILKGISETRNLSSEKLNALADSVQTFKKGEELVAAGLVDAAKYKDQILDDLREITGIEGTKGVPVVSVSDYADAEVKEYSKPYSRDKIAVIYASGDIGMSVGTEVIIGDELSKEIRKVRQDSSYKAIVLRVDSPGGSAFDSETIWREMKLAADEKTVVVSFGDVAASGGYYIATPAHKIIAQPNTITGSIGVFAIIPDFSELLNEKLGITTDVVRTNKNSDLLSVTRPLTPFERQMLQENVEETYDIFVSHVAEGRNLTTTEVDTIGQGRVWSGENAMEIGLIDAFGGLEDAIVMAAEMEGLETYRTVSLPRLPDPFEQLFKTGTKNIRTKILKTELGEKYRFYEFLKKTSQMKGIYARMPYDVWVN